MKNTAENNKLIAKFIKLGFAQDPRGSSPLFYTRNNLDYKSSELKFHSSWDWLMPVVSEVGKSSDENTLEIIKDIEYGLINVSIGNVYEGVIEFIKWYNENK